MEYIKIKTTQDYQIKKKILKNKKPIICEITWSKTNKYQKQ